MGAIICKFGALIRRQQDAFFAFDEAGFSAMLTKRDLPQQARIVIDGQLRENIA
jgi:hypothetical protein